MSISSEGIAKIYRNNIWKLHRVFRKILSDWGPQSISRFMEKFTKVLGTKKQLSMAYHPQTDGQMERINQEIGTFLRHYVNYQQNDWTNWLAATEFQYNDKQHTATGKTPFKLNFRRHPWKGDLVVQTMIPWVEKFIKKLRRSWKQTMSALEEDEESIWQEKKKSSRIEGRRQCVAREQKYPFEPTLKEVG